MVVCHHLHPLLQAMWTHLTSLVQQLLQQTVMEGEEALSASLAMAGTLADTASTMLQPSSLDSSSSSGAGDCVDGSDGNLQKSGQTGSLGTAVQMLEFAVQLLDHAKQQAGELAPLQQEQQGQLGAEEGSSGLSQQVADIQQQVGSGCTPRRCCMRPALCPCSVSALTVVAVTDVSASMQVLQLCAPTKALTRTVLRRCFCSLRRPTWPASSLLVCWSAPASCRTSAQAGRPQQASCSSPAWPSCSKGSWAQPARSSARGCSKAHRALRRRALLSGRS